MRSKLTSPSGPCPVYDHGARDPEKKVELHMTGSIIPVSNAAGWFGRWKGCRRFQRSCTLGTVRDARPLRVNQAMLRRDRRRRSSNNV